MSDLRARLERHAIPYLAVLLGCYPDEAWDRDVTFLVAEHGKKPWMIHGPLRQHAEELDRLNRAGAAIMVTVNATDGYGVGRENIVEIRAWTRITRNGVCHFREGKREKSPSFQVHGGDVVDTYWLNSQRVALTSEKVAEYEFELDCIGRGERVNQALRLPGFFMYQGGDRHLVSFWFSQLIGIKTYTQDEIRCGLIQDRNWPTYGMKYGRLGRFGWLSPNSPSRPHEAPKAMDASTAAAVPSRPSGDYPATAVSAALIPGPAAGVDKVIPMASTSLSVQNSMFKPKGAMGNKLLGLMASGVTSTSDLAAKLYPGDAKRSAEAKVRALQAKARKRAIG